jgi:hypothetical protein
LADRHDVDPVDGFRLTLHTRLDAAHQRRDLGTAEVFGDVKARDNPHPARAEEGDQDFANAGYPGVGEQEGSHLLFVGRRERLGEVVGIAIPRNRGSQRPGADQEVVTALDEPETDADKHQPDEHRGHALGYGRPGDLVEGQGGKGDHVSRNRHRVLEEDGPQGRVRRDLGLVYQAPVVTAPTADHLARRLAE